MLDPQASRFWQATLLSGLMDAQDLTACWEAIAPAKREVAEHIDRRLARQAVQAKSLTLWQAQQLLAGRTAGYKVDRYILLDLIGQGGMGRVYLARDSRLNRQVALKILSPERVSKPRAIARFQREARVGAQLQHENLVRIYDFGESNGRYYLVMEYIEGKTIGTLISEQGQMSPATAVRLVRQVALGLEHAHRKGLIHRDVNPYNVLVTRDGTAKLADLGLAIDLSEGDHVTREGATVGTFDYVAPEQARHSHAADIRSDIYSLGCTIYHMCAGQVPFPSPSLPEKLFAHQAMEPTPLNELVAGFPQGLAEIIDRMMRKSPDERFATPLQVVQALEPYAEEQSNTATRQVVSPPEHQPETGPSPRSPRPEFDQASTPAPHLVNAEQAKALGKTVAVLDGSEPSRLGANDNGFTTHADRGSPAPRNLSDDHDPSDPDFPLSLDLGPEPSLSEGLARPKPRSTVELSAPTALLATSLATSARRLFAPRPGRWVALTIMVVAVVAVLVAVLALVKPFDRFRLGKGDSSHAAGNGDLASNAATDSSIASLNGGPAIIVRTEGENVQEYPRDKLLEAIQTAMGRGVVELRGAEPFHLAGNRNIDLNSGRGRLVVRAAPGYHPVIKVELNGPKPPLATGSGISLELSGLSIEVRYAQQSVSRTPPAVILAAGSAKIERCAFMVVGDEHPKGSCAISSDGGVLDVNQSWFEGFDETIDIAAMNKTTARIRQTMIVSAHGPAQAQGPPAAGSGWAVKLRLGVGGKPPSRKPLPHLVMEQCTIEAAGLINLSENPAPYPLEVEVNNCAVMAETLLACKSATPPSAQVRWSGKGNQYAILGRYWIVLSASDRALAASGAPTDLASWLLFAPGDTGPIHDKLQFLADPPRNPGSRRPRDFSIQDSIAPRIRPGADPKLVGPWSI